MDLLLLLAQTPPPRPPEVAAPLNIWGPMLGIIVLLAAAMVLGSVAERAKQSAIVGFMGAGLLLGPNVLQLIDKSEITAIADLGVTLLMFTIGLEFSWSRLRRLGVTALLTGVLQIVATISLAVGVSRLFGFDVKAGLALGAVFALSSTGVVMPVLARRAEVDSVHGRFALGILLVQDIAVIPLVLLVAALGGEGTPTQVIGQTVGQFGVVAGFVVFCVAFSKYLVPLVVRFNAPTGNREVSVLFAIVMSLGAAWGAQRFGLSPALGAFIAAIFLGESAIAPRLRGDVGPLRTVFVTLFFSSIGMLADPHWMFFNALPLAVAVGLLFVLKPTVVWIVGHTFGLAHRHAVAAGVCMGQVGVFSFVLASSAAEKGVITDDTFALVVSVTIVTLFATPYLVALGVPTGRRVEQLLRRVGMVKTGLKPDAALNRELSSHVVVVGFGPAGRAVANRMYQSGSTVVVVDLNPISIRAARDAGMRAWVGDASSPDMLKQVSIDTAEALVVTLPDYRLTMAVIVEARELSPDLQIVARARYHRHVELLATTGANLVIDEEATVGDKLSETLRLKVRTDSEKDHEVIREDQAVV